MSNRALSAADLARLLGSVALAAPLAACAPAPHEAVPLEVGPGVRVQVDPVSFKDLRDRYVVKQAFDYSCGAAALATLLTYGLGDPTSERDVVAAMLANLDQDQETLRRKEGFSLLDMQAVAQERGYRAQGFRIAPEVLGDLQGPTIVFIRPRGYEHFAVLRGVRGGTVYLADPSRGNVRESLATFLDMWLGEDGKGIIFIVEPEDGDLGRSVLAVGGTEQRRPELLGVRQLLDIGRQGRLGQAL